MTNGSPSDRSQASEGMDSQMSIQGLTRSCNEVLILSILATGPHHGYQLALELDEKSGGAFQFKHGTLYPILHKLEQEQLIVGDWLEEKTQRKRKSYRLTAEGRRHLTQQVQTWQRFVRRFFDVVGEV